MAGLKEYWDLGDPAALDPAVHQRIAASREAFLAAMGQVNTALQYLAANAPEAKHDQLASRREKLYALYQKVVESHGNDARAVDGLIIHAGRLREEASELARSTQRWKELWEQQSESLETDDSGSSDADDHDQPSVRDHLARATEAADRRDYETAVGVLTSTAGPAGRSASAAADATEADVPGGPPAVNERRYPLGGADAAPPAVPSDHKALKSWTNPLIEVDPRELFDPLKMDAVADMHFQGESTPEDPALNQAMTAILFAKEGEDVTAQWKKIGELRDLDEDTITQQRQRFEHLQEVAKKLAASRGDDPDPVMGKRRDEYLATHGDFLGTRSSLRFGQVVGEATGLDPAIAAMLNPTGGMVGPGMDVLAPTDANSPVILHGIFHDAGGYLLNYQNAGPGYTYLPDKAPESGRAGAHPLQGQVEGVSYWYERRQPDRTILEDIYDADAKQMAYATYVEEPIQDAERFAQEFTRDTVDDINAVLDDARQTNREAAASLKQLTRDTAENIDEATDVAEQAVDLLAEKVRAAGIDQETVAEAEQSIDDHLHAVRTRARQWNQEAANSISQASQLVDESIDRMEQWTGAAAGVAEQEISAIAAEVEGAVHDQLVELGQDEELLEFARDAVNRYGEAELDAQALHRDIVQQIDRAEAEVRQLCDQAEAELQQMSASGEAMIVSAAEDLEAARAFVIDKLHDARETAGAGLNRVAGEMRSQLNELASTARDIRDAAGGVVDSLGDAVEVGTDVLSNVAGSATDFAADRLDRLTNLLG